MRDAILPLVAPAARLHGLDPALACAVIEQESGWDTWAVNPEPSYRWLWDFRRETPFRALRPEERHSEVPPADFYAPGWVDRDAEWWCQQMSWGLMQVMGAVARERGLRVKFLTRLCDPAYGIEYGCRHLAHLLKVHDNELRKALLAYNGGGNREYPTEVLARRMKYEPEMQSLKEQI